MSEKNNNQCGCGCGHDHGHDHEEGYQTITLTLDDNSELVCIVLGIFEFEGNEYIALIPEDEEEGDDVYIYTYKELAEDEIELDIIEDDELFERVSDKFDELFVEEEEEE